METASPIRTPTSELAWRYVCVLLVVCYAFVVIRTAWLCDDAYITLRVVDNFVNGYGLTWNIAERVQAYTHPLWMFLVSGVYYFTHEAYYTTLLISIGVSVLAVLVLVFGAADTYRQGGLAIAILVLSRSFVDFSTGGLENPLTHLLLAGFWCVYGSKEVTPGRCFGMVFLAALTAVNRIDTLVLLGPPLLGVFLYASGWRARLVGMLGFLPLVAWEVFSLLYYGCPFPNTAYAKLCLGIPGKVLVEQGLFYLLSSISIDPITLVIMCSAVIWAFLARQWRQCCAAVGLILAMVYVVYVGGDYMSGRFLSAPLMMAVCMIATLRSVFIRAGWLPSLAAVLLIGFATPDPSFLSGANYQKKRREARDAHDIQDERSVWYKSTGLLLAPRDEQMPLHDWKHIGLRLKARGPSVDVRGHIGLVGYYAGPELHIIDTYALADSLLARLPMEPSHVWWIGHFPRNLPAGYYESVASGHNRIVDPSLAQYYEHVRMIAQGPIFDWERLITIYRMNMGVYNDLLVNYATTPRRMSLASLSVPVKDGALWNAPPAVVLTPGGILVDLNHVHKPEFLEVGLDHNDDYQISYLRSGQTVAEQISSAQMEKRSGIHCRKMVVPAAVRVEGVDEILVKPCRGDGMYSIGHLRLIGDETMARGA